MADVFRVPLRIAPLQQPGAPQALFGSALALLWLAVFALLFRSDAAAAVRVWIVSPTFNHCFLIVPLVVFLIWNRRAALADVSARPDWRAAFAILALVPAWFLAFVAGVIEAEQFVVVTMLQCALFGTLGAGGYRKLAAPFLYLYFLIPSGAWLVPFLQGFTARFAVVGLHLLRIPVFSNGAVIDIPAGSFAVAEACAGLRFLVAAFAFGVFFAVLTYRSWMRRLAFVALSIVVPVIANGFRALGLIAAAQWIGNPAAALADHIIYGWIFFSFVLVLLIAAGQFFSDRIDTGTAAPRTPDAKPRVVNFGRIAMAAAACLLAAASAPASVRLLPHHANAALPARAPSVAPPWREIAADSGWHPLVAGAARVFSQTFVDGPRRVDRFIALYRNDGPDGKIVRSNNRAADERAWSFDFERNGHLLSGAVPVHVSVWLKGSKRRVVWSFFVIDGHAAAGFGSAKWDALRAYVAGTKCLSAYVALSEAGPDQQLPSSADATRLLGATQDLAGYLCGPSRTARR